MNAHYAISLSVMGDIETTWHVSSHYCSVDAGGKASACQRAIEEALARGYALTIVRATAPVVDGICEGWEILGKATKLSLGERFVFRSRWFARSGVDREPATEALKKIEITMSERRPIKIDPELWPIVARADWYDGEIECQANYVRWIKVREHEDGRRIVYGVYTSGNGGAPLSFRGATGGFLVDAASGEPNENETIRAIRRVGGIIEDDCLADECIGDMPSEEV